MPGIGTGFDENIKLKLEDFLKSCYNGLRIAVSNGLNPKKGIEKEFTEI